MNFGVPTNNQNVWNGSSIDPAWYTYFVNGRNWIVQNSQSGTTAQRPTTNLYNGLFYFDTTIGKPIWYLTSGWIKADGTSA